MLNICDSDPGLMEEIEALEDVIADKAEKVMRPMQPGDVTATQADASKLHALSAYQPKAMLREGLQRFAERYRGYYGTAG